MAYATQRKPTSVPMQGRPRDGPATSPRAPQLPTPHPRCPPTKPGTVTPPGPTHRGLANPPAPAFLPPPTALPGARPPQARGPTPEGSSDQEPGRGTQGPGLPPRHTKWMDHGPRAGNAEGHKRHGTALPAPSTGTARGARATPTRGGGPRTPREHERIHTQTACGAYLRGNRTEPAERTDCMEWRTGRRGKGAPGWDNPQHALRGAQGNWVTTGGGKENWRQPSPPRPAASAVLTRTGYFTRQGSSGAKRYAPAPQLGSLMGVPLATSQ